MAINDRVSGINGKIVGDLEIVSKLDPPTKSRPWEYGAVMGHFLEPSQARRSFVAYLNAERPGRRSPMVHYNSWYDFYSYQDEGFNGGFKDRVPDEKLIGSLRPDKLSESNCLSRIRAFGEELVEKRHTQIDSFLWDDGWDNSKSLWSFDKERFPRGFNNMSDVATNFNAGTGVWLSPWGGYGFPKQDRVQYGKQHGWETNLLNHGSEEGFSLAGTNYRKAFKGVAMKMVKEEGVNMFKFDGVAGNPMEKAVEMEAMFSLISELRRESGKLKRKRRNKDKNKNNDDDIWINLTTGTWASPFFLFWADSIWRGGGDIPSGEDFLPDAFQDPQNPGQMIRPKEDGLTRRQRWIRWRNLIVYENVYLQSHFFPISQLMIHGMILASHGDAYAYGLDEFDTVDFTQEVWSFLGLGQQLQELYVAPRYMTPEAWDILAEGLRWARKEAPILRDSHWAFGDPRRREVYAVASWDVDSARGFIMIHNPTGEAQRSVPFSLQEILELPAHQSEISLRLSIIKSVFRSQKKADGRAQLLEERLFGAACDALLLAENVQVAPCAVDSQSQVHVAMRPTEVLVLEIQEDKQLM